MNLYGRLVVAMVLGSLVAGVARASDDVNRADYPNQYCAHSIVSNGFGVFAWLYDKDANVSYGVQVTGLHIPIVAGQCYAGKVKFSAHWLGQGLFLVVQDKKGKPKVVNYAVKQEVQTAQ